MSSYQTVEHHTIEDDAFHAYIVERSRFLSLALHTPSKVSIHEKIEQMQKVHSRATHITYAYRLKSGEEKAHDAGEPQGSAGLPILEVLKQKDLENTLLFVIRYFGGKKLGKSGLIRAYRKAALLALAGSIITMRKIYTLTLRTTYQELQQIENILRKDTSSKPLLQILDAQYAETVSLTLSIPVENIPTLQNALPHVFMKVSIREENLTYQKYP